jgi:hypothetical protein
MALDAGGISAIVFSALFVIVSAAYLFSFSKAPSPPDFSGLLDFSTKIVAYSPYCLLAFGWIADAASGNYFYTKSGITGIIGIIINAIVGGIIKGSASKPTPQSGGGSWWQWVGDISSVADDTSKCSLPGLSSIENPYAPQGIVLSTTIFFYLLTGLWDAGLGMQSIALSVITGVTFMIQWITLSANGCLKDGYFGQLAPLTSFVMGVVFAVASYFIQKLISPASVAAGGPDGGKGGGLDQGVNNPGAGSNGEIMINVGGKSGQTEPVNDQDQFVCEAYKDGELVTSTIAG